MNPHRTNITVLLFTVLIVTNCWDKQSHEVTQPEWPHYELSGHTVMMHDTSQTVSNATVKLYPSIMIYDVSPDMQTTVVDTNGFFHFDTAYPGLYILQVYRDKYRVVSKQININYSDRFLQVSTPDYLVSDRKISKDVNSPAGAYRLLIAWVGTKAWLTGSYIQNLKAMPALHQCRPALQASTGQLHGVKYYDDPLPEATVLDVADRLLYRAFGSTVLLIDPTTGQTLSEFTMEGSEKFYGLTQNSRGIWTVFGRILQFRGKDIRTVQETYQTGGSYFNCITAAGGAFYIFDTGDQVMLKLKQDGSILNAYRLFGSKKEIWLQIVDISYSEYDERLWITTDGKSIYTIPTP
ncbi:MAG: hypothetical protein K9N46_09245 [Candidatus Marinimicrobia bacterium]|nr:hypothetical protein [Candidatus Neomarinimicrobiota bacterium]MCF7829424.1 hypothetical protein [Candidatus Neomarinimicrobiota bacterium]MCF7880910.1 hypothetical protein [Candidatus Neomarinimicrobiota bacterium]